MVLLQCCRKECRRVWDFQGKNKYVAKCPVCFTTVSIKKNEVKLNKSGVKDAE